MKMKESGLRERYAALALPLDPPMYYALKPVLYEPRGLSVTMFPEKKVLSM